MKRDRRVRSPYLACWVFTVNNPEEQLSPQFWEDCRLAAWQLEMGEEGTPHFQGYVEFNRRKRRAWIVANCEGLEAAWIEVRLLKDFWNPLTTFPGPCAEKY